MTADRAVWASGAGGTVLVWALAGMAAAQTAPSPGDVQNARIQALEGEVRDLSAQVRELTAEVRKLKAPLAGRPGPAPAAPPPAAVPAASGPKRLAKAARPLGEPRVAENSTHRLMLESPEGYSIGLTGLVQFDVGVYDFRADNAFVGPQALSNGVNARRARIGVVGATPGGFGYAFVYDAGNSQDSVARGVETAQLVYGGLRGAAFEIGYSNTFFTLDQSTSSADTLFLERSSASNIATSFNAGDFRANAGARVFGKRYWAGAYLTGPASGESHTRTAERFGAFERVAVQALAGKAYSLHLGVGVDQLIQASGGGTGAPNSLTLSDQPELRIDPTTLLDTGALGTAAHPVAGGRVWDLETAATRNGLFWQGEYYGYQVSRAGLPQADFHGWYGQAAWAVTGETHTYNEQAGAYFRIFPSHPFDPAKGWWGAWELAARLDQVDLDSRFGPGVALAADPAAVAGGTQRGVTLGLNWYVNDLVRLMLDYNHIDYDKANGVKVPGAPLGAPVGGGFDAISLRAQATY